MLQSNTLNGESDVIINPFEHQVGGHKVVLQISRRFICKPREESEVEFYRQLPDCLRDCVPLYRGEIQVQCIKGDRGLELHAKVPSELKNEIDNETSNTSFLDNNLQPVHVCSELSSTDTDSSNGKNGLSDWSKECLNRTMHQYALWSNNSIQQFVVLENLLADFDHPCILDIKLGRKQRLSDCSEEKRKLLERRCAHSTSAKMGFRICGMQLYQKNTDEYISQNKYVGRQLDQEGAILNLKQFFNDGLVLRTKEIEKAIEKLKHIQDSITKQNVFKFLSVSLLLIYDSTFDCQVDVRLIDFANALTNQNLPFTEVSTDCNEDLLFGLKTLTMILEEFLVPSTV